MARDNFTTETVNSLGKRVGFLCSNPACGKHTSGPHTDPAKVTIIGEAAHITAASIGGPRYDANMTRADRRSIENGIWLCSSCSDLIDKDPAPYPVSLLKKWKVDAEQTMLANLMGQQKDPKSSKTPYLEADLIWTGGLRSPRGYSNKNPVTIDENGHPVRIIGAGSKPIIHWEIKWKYTLAIHNNSSHHALNVNIENIGNVHFSQLEKLPKVNNIPPFSSIELKAELFERVEDTHVVADKIMSYTIPVHAEGLTLRISYLDEDRREHSTTVRVIDNQLVSEKN